MKAEDEEDEDEEEEEEKGDKDDRGCEHNGKGEGATGGKDTQHGKEDPGEPPGRADQDGLEEKLQPDIPLSCSHGASNADFPEALCDRSQHDVHDPNAPDDQGDGADTKREDIE